ncbi:TolC family protein [Porticoccaceae bacterium]|nr:TolC family protein [Porticoccaceae bacterium]
MWETGISKNLLKSLSIILLLFASKMPPSLAEDIPFEEPLTLIDAMTLAVKYHPLVASREGDYQAALGDLSAARWSAFPTPSYSARGLFDSGSQNSFSLSQPLWTGGRLSGNIELAESRRDNAVANIVEVEQILLEDSARAFIEFHRANSKLTISVDNVTEHKRLFDIIDRRVKAAISPEVDAMLAKARLAFARSQVLQNTSAKEVARSELEQLIGRAVNNVSAPVRFSASLVPLSDIENAAIAFSPKLRAIQSEIAGLNANARIASSALYPQVSLGYERRFGELLFAQEREQVFVALEFQPGAGLASRSSISASKARVRAAIKTLAASRRELRRKVQIAWREYESARLQLSPSRQLVSATTEVVSSYLRQYTVGRKSWLDVLNAQREVVQAQHTLADYEAIELIASYQIRLLSGALNKNTLSDSNE